MKLSRRLIGSLAAGGILTVASLGFAGAASAAGTAFSFTPSSPPNGMVGTQTLVVKATCSDVILVVQCNIPTLKANITGPDPIDMGSSTSGANSTVATLQFTWNTVAAAKHNGVYTVNATATEQAPAASPQDFTGSATLKVNNPPVAPSGVQATLDPAANNTPVVTWNPNPEPDITGYELFRSDDGAAPVPVGSAHDTTAPQGKSLAYFVVAVRSSPVFDGGITSCNGAAPCQPTLSTVGMGKAAPVTVPVPPPPAPAPAPAPAAAAPIAVATADPVPAPPARAGAPIPASAVTGATGTGSVGQQPVGFAPVVPRPISGPTLPTTIVQLPAPKVVQFAPLLPYSGKIPEVPKAAAAVPAPVQANTTEVQTTEIQVPVLGHVKPVDAAKYFAAAGFLIVGAIHIIRLAHRLTHPEEVSAATTGGASLGAGTLSLARRTGLRLPMPFRRSGS